jgi:class 3 adenylate cyclase
MLSFLWIYIFFVTLYVYPDYKLVGILLNIYGPPGLLMIIVVAFKKSMLNRFQFIATTILSLYMIATWVFNLITKDFTVVPIFTFIGFIIAFFVVRLRFKTAIIFSVLFSIAFTLLLLLWDAPTGRGTGNTPGIIFILFALSAITGYNLEQANRKIFVQGLIIDEQRQKIIAEKAKSDALLLNTLPIEIVSRLKGNIVTGHEVIADSYENVSVLFTDIVGFTGLSSNLSAQEIVKLLNDIFLIFDNLVDKHGLEKIKTIGDSYMVAAGVPSPKDTHALDLVNLGIDMIKELNDYNKQTGFSISVRIGINSGPVVAGVIGRKKFLYDLWGDTVNTAARMESYGIPNRVQVTETTRSLVSAYFQFDDRGQIDVKGKGIMRVFLVRE